MEHSRRAFACLSSGVAETTQPVQVTRGAEPMIIATLEGRKGRVELRGAQ
jgi:hypothetical protein